MQHCGMPFITEKAINNYDYNEIDKNAECLAGYYPKLSKIKNEKIKGRK